MKVAETVADARALCQEARRPLGLVPTMGFLHEGHMALVKRARTDNDTLAVSVFVNPLQFGSSEDISTYPRDVQGDLSKLEVAGVDLVFAPPRTEMYPDGFDTFVDVGRIASRLEGEFRSNHFRGVATVVCKLLSIVRPDTAYFGQKDAQQLVVVRRLCADLNLGADVVAVPTVRDADGLALSSRNAYLSRDERETALALYKSLRLAQRLWEDGVTDAGSVRAQMGELLGREPLAKVDYVSIAHAETLEELDRIESPALVSLAVRIGKARLIDNILL